MPTAALAYLQRDTYALKRVWRIICYYFKWMWLALTTSPATYSVQCNWETVCFIQKTQWSFDIQCQNRPHCKLTLPAMMKVRLCVSWSSVSNAALCCVCQSLFRQISLKTHIVSALLQWRGRVCPFGETEVLRGHEVSAESHSGWDQWSTDCVKWFYMFEFSVARSKCGHWATWRRSSEIRVIQA